MKRVHLIGFHIPTETLRSKYVPLLERDGRFEVVSIRGFVMDGGPSVGVYDILCEGKLWDDFKPKGYTLGDIVIAVS